MTSNANTDAPQSVATFAAGCFWSVELHFQRLPGVVDTKVGYINGHTVNPTYRQVCSGTTGHAEAVQVTFDSTVISYQDLVDKFFSIHDPTTLNRQKNDVGTQYRSGIYYHNDDQKDCAVASKKKRQKRPTPPHQRWWRSILHAVFGCIGDVVVVTEVLPAGQFYIAEEYHQRYLEKGGQCAAKGSTASVRCYGMSLACHPTACMMSSSSSTAAATPPMQDVATFAAGCFWGVELHFQRVPGVLDTRVGYTNGHTLNPTYKDICRGDTGHAEAVQVTFDSAIVPYKDLLEKFWSIHDPTTLNRQKNDVGTQYRSGIYYHNDEQKALAEASKATQQTHLHATALLPRIISSRDIVTEIEPAGVFYPAEDYHQQYLQKGGQCAKKGTTDSIRCYG
ncbi:hypothetical protein DYB25_003397 [Aphanomyces astaci]|uniref:peptide-methionine (S)-S-oxide reductase n=1 Tax=Aphanomyces astaci TaxID=112090 RepID=A0A397B7G1_APHAT|nr:hypothetical protein DYB25_003397 [Aphanomyces astaci]